ETRRRVGVPRRQEQEVPGGLCLVAQGGGSEVAQTSPHAVRHERRKTAQHCGDERDDREGRGQKERREREEDSRQDSEPALAGGWRDRHVDRVPALAAEEAGVRAADEMQERRDMCRLSDERREETGQRAG